MDGNNAAETEEARVARQFHHDAAAKKCGNSGVPAMMTATSARALP